LYASLLPEYFYNHRETCIDRMYFDKKGLIKPVKISKKEVQNDI